MPAPRRDSSKSQGSDGPPLKKRRVKEIAATSPPSSSPLDSTAIDRGLDLTPLLPPAPLAPPVAGEATTEIPPVGPVMTGTGTDHHAAALDSFDLFLDDPELHVDSEAVMQHEHTSEEPSVPRTKVDRNENKEEPEVEQQKEAVKKKKKTKRRSSAQGSVKSVMKESKPSSMDIVTIKKKYGKARLERIRKQAIKDALKEYQEETNRVVQQLPIEITSMFGQIGYGRFGKKWFPVLIVSPYDVAFERVRSEWYTTFEKALEGKIKFAHLGFWIGEKEGTYSPLSQGNFVLYDKANKVQERPLNNIRKKIEKGAKIKENSEEEYLYRALHEVERLLKLEPEERRRQIPHTRHPFEDLSIDEILQDMAEKNLTVESVEKDMSDDEDIDEEMADSTDGRGVDDDVTNKRAAELAEHTQQAVLLKAKKKNKIKKRKEKQGEKSLLSAKEDRPPEPESGESHLPIEPQNLPGRNENESSDEEDLEEDLPSDDDKNDDDFDLDDAEEPNNRSADEDLVDSSGRPIKKARKKKLDSPGKKESPKKEKKTSEKASKPKTRPEDMTDKQRREWISRTFKRNEDAFVPLLENLHKINEQSTSEQIHDLLTELESNIHRMCWVFIELHAVPVRLKPAKTILKSRGEDFSRVAELKGKMKTQYEENKKHYPKVEPKTMRAATYLENTDMSRHESVSKKSVGKESTKKRSTGGNQDEEKGRQQESISNAEKSGYSRSSIDSRRDKIGNKRDSLDFLSQSDQGIRKRDSTGSLGQLDRANQKKEGLALSLKRKDPDAPRSRSETPTKRPVSDQSQPAESVKTNRVPEEKSGDNLRKSASTEALRKKELGRASIESGRKSPAKPKPKSFSLGSFMSSTTQEKPSTQAKQVTSKQVVKAPKPLPAWMRTAMPADSLPGIRSRLFGLEFFRDMAQYFPADKVNREAIALTLEAETYRWAKAKSRETPPPDDESGEGEAERSESEVLKKYWKRVRTIVAVVCGKLKPGNLFYEIMNGDFESARDLVTMPDDKFLAYAKRDLGFR